MYLFNGYITMLIYRCRRPHRSKNARRAKIKHAGGISLEETKSDFMIHHCHP